MHDLMSQIEVPVAIAVIVLSCVFAALSVIVLLFSRNAKWSKPTYYELGQPWDREPVLMSAVDEPNVAPHDYHAPEGVNDPEVLIGGSSHGKW